jgi:hypothetical protein
MAYNLDDVPIANTALASIIVFSGSKTHANIGDRVEASTVFFIRVCLLSYCGRSPVLSKVTFPLATSVGPQ